MPNRTALSRLKEYKSLELDKKLFQHKLHHLGDSFESFWMYSSSVSSFKPLECNQLLIDRLSFILAEIGKGASRDRSSLEKLIERSFKEIPCSRYINCKGHKFDPTCKHRR
ncbi:MAG: hypothetical protein ABSD70_16930 [Terracidiphilus sp.]|jgi:hypothetical protein